MISYRGNECRPTNGVRHFWIDFGMVKRFNVGRALHVAAQRADTYAIESLTKLAAAVGDAPVYIMGPEVSVCWQGSDESNKWIAPNMGLPYSGDSHALASKILKASALNREPIGLIAALGGMRVQCVRGQDDNCLYANGHVAFIESDGLQANYRTLAQPNPVTDLAGAA